MPKGLQFRKCDEHLLSDGILDHREILRWSEKGYHKPYCYAVAYWKKRRAVKFVQYRWFNRDLPRLLWLIARHWWF